MPAALGNGGHRVLSRRVFPLAAPGLQCQGPAGMFEVREKPQMVERALLVRLYFDPRDEEESEALLEELGELVSTLGIGVVEKVLSRSREMHRKFLCGTGKAAEIVELAKAHECDCIVFEDRKSTRLNSSHSQP